MQPASLSRWRKGFATARRTCATSALTCHCVPIEDPTDIFTQVAGIDLEESTSTLDPGDARRSQKLLTALQISVDADDLLPLILS
jgi:hypothetical protein